MSKTFKFKVGVQLLTLGALSGTMLGSGCLDKIGSNINPCGTVIDCDPLEWDLMFMDYPDWEEDPTCTIPGMCGGSFPLGTGGTDDDTEN